MIDKLTGESSKAYQALQDYWNLGASRTLRKLQGQYQERESPPTKSYPTISRWSSKFKWEDRIAQEIVKIAQENESIAQEERQKLFKEQFNIVRNAIEIEAKSRQFIDYDKLSLAQYNALIANIWKMLADLRTNDTQKIALTDPAGNQAYQQIDATNVVELIDRIQKRKNEQP